MQCTISSSNILLQSLKNTKFHRYLRVSYKHSERIYVSLGHSVSSALHLNI
jgi:hypothetical protein